MAPIYRIAVIQLYPKPMQPQQNFDKAAYFIRSAASQGCHLAVLPEYHLTNWKPKDPTFLSHCVDWERYLKAYQVLAKELSICIVPGTIVQTPEGFTGSAGGERVLCENVAYFISNDGSIAGSYKKKNLWGAIERDHLSSSGRDAHPVINTPLGPIGLLICWDLAFPEAWRELISQGAKMIIVPTFWTLSDCSPSGLRLNPTAEATFLDSTLTARAFENTCAVVFANAGGPPGRGYAGLSQVTAPFIGPMTRLGSCVEGMAAVDLDMQIIEDAEAAYQVRADLGREDWHYDYRHDKATKSNL